MPEKTNDALVRRHRELRATLIEKHAKLAAERIMKLKKPTVERVAETIVAEFEASPV